MATLQLIRVIRVTVMIQVVMKKEREQQVQELVQVEMVSHQQQGTVGKLDQRGKLVMDNLFQQKLEQRFTRYSVHLYKLDFRPFPKMFHMMHLRLMPHSLTSCINLLP